MTEERREYLYSQIKLHDKQKINRSKLCTLNDKNLEDIYEIYKIDTVDKRFCKTYLRYILRNIKNPYDNNIMDDDEDYKIFLDIVNKYYVDILKNFISIRPSYIYGIKNDDCSTIRRDCRVYEDILKYVQNLFISFLSTDDNKNVYQYIMNNNCPGLATYYIDKHKTVNIKLYEKDVENIMKELRFVDGIHIINKSPISLYHQTNIFHREFKRYLHESGLRELYYQLERNKVRRSSSELSSIAISQFLENEEYDAVYKFYDKYFPDRNFSLDVALIKEFNPDLYAKYSQRVDNYSKSNYAMMCATGRKLKNAIIEHKYKLPFLKFLKIYNPKTLEQLIFYYNSTIRKLDDDMFNAIYSYLRRMSFAQININDVYTSKVTVAGRELTKEDKDIILKYIKDNELPYMIRVYNELYRLYLTDRIDLNIPFKEQEI